MPDFSFEQAIRDRGARLIAGIDEAGRYFMLGCARWGRFWAVLLVI